MTKQKAPVVTKQTVENVGSTVKMSSQVSTSRKQNDEIHMSAGIKFDTKRMTWVCAETGLVCDQDSRDRSQIADKKTARQNSDNLIDGPSERKKDANAESIVSFTTKEMGHDPHIIAGSRIESEETGTTKTMGNCVEIEAVYQNESDMGPDQRNNLQAVAIKNGVVKADNTDGEIHHFSDFEENPRGGLFWKLSEFHRRSGKQGLETRFELLSPTIIVDCSANYGGSDEQDQTENSSSGSEDLSCTEYSANCGSETAENTHRSETNQTNFPKDEVMECAPADSVSELERDDTKVRCLRKRKPVEYYPKAYGQPSKTETDKNEFHSHTVLDWYKETAKMMREFKELDTKREDSNPVKVCKRKRLNESCRSIRRHKFVRVVQIADYSFHDKSPELNSLPTKSLAFFATLAGTKDTAEEFVINVANEKEHLVEDFQDISTHNNIKESDFDIDSILQELNPKHRYEPSNAVEMKKLCDEKEVMKETVGNEPKEVSIGTDSCLLSPNYCFVNDEEHSLIVPGNNNEVTCNSIDNGNCIKDVRRVSVLEIETEMPNIYSDSATSPPYEEAVSGEGNSVGEVSERALRKGLRNLSPVTYFPNRKRRIGNQDRKTSVVRNKKGEKLDSKTNDILDVSENAQTNSLNILSENEQTVEVLYYENENSNKENYRKANDSDQRGMEDQTKQNQIESLSSFSEGQLECVPLKQTILDKICNNKVVIAFQEQVNNNRGQKHKRNKRCSNGKSKGCSNAKLKMDGNNSKLHALNPFNEVTNIHTESFNLSTVLVTDSEKPLSDFLQSDFIAQKRVLRNRSPVSYFPDKKQRKQAVKGPCDNNQTHMRNKEMDKKVLMEEEKNNSFMPRIVADNCSAVPYIQVCNFQPKSSGLGSIIPAHGQSVGNTDTHDRIVKSVKSCIHTSDRSKQDIVDNVHDSDISVTDQNEAHQNGIAESFLHPGIEEEKAANVHSALVGLYAAEKIKGRQDRSLVAADFKRLKTEFEPDRYISALQNVSEDQIGVTAEGASSEVEIGSTMDLDDLTCSVNTKESDLEQNSGEIRQGYVTDKPLSCTVLSKIAAAHAHIDGSVENTSRFVHNSEPVEVEDFAPPGVIMEESKSPLQTKSPHVEGAEIYENDILDGDHSLTEQRRISSANTETGNAQTLQIGTTAATKEIASCKIYPVGTVVWGRFSKTRWWPAIVVDGKMLKRETRQGRSWVMWLSDNKVSELKDNHIELFTCQYKQRTHGRLTESMKIGILKALQICADRAELDLSSFQSVEEWGQSQSGFLQLSNQANDTDQFPPAEASPLPPFVLEQLGIITKSMHSDNRVAVLDDNRVNDPDDSNFCPDDSRVVVPDPVAWKRNKAKGKKIEACEGPDGKICLSCDVLLREDYQVFQHPLFEGLMCRKCKDDMMSSFYAIDDDGCSLFCCICSEGGKLFVCEKELCGRAYCFTCVDRHSEHDLVNQISQTNPWHCFLCTSYSLLTHGSLTPRKDWSLEIVKFFQTDNTPLCNDLDYLTAEKKRKIRVLSLYDGIGTGKLVLNELGLDVEAYYASEINKDAMLVSSVHHDVTHIGDASLLTRAQLIKMCPIDLVIGGPPCNDLSIVNPLRKGFSKYIHGVSARDGTGMLLMKFIYILKDVEALSKGKNHVFWLLENTGSMLTDFKQVVCSLLRMEPAIWDAKYFTGQKRARCFWGNIPGLYSTPEFCKQLQQEKKDLDAALIPNCNRKALVSHTRTITTGTNSLTITNGGEDMPIEMNGVEDRIWVSELERLFGFPDHYTDVGHLSPTIRHKLLGKAWCVPVIKYILSPLKNYFALKET